MKLDLPLPLLLLGSLALPSLSQTSQPPGLEGIDDPEIAKKVIDYWSDYSCFILSDQSQPHVKEQCKEACFPGGVSAEVPSTDIVQSSQLCWLNGPEAEYRSGNPLTEEQLKENPRTVKTIRTGYCVCNHPILEIAGEFYIKSIDKIGEILSEWMCPMLAAMDLLVEVGSMAIPGVGKAITSGMKMSIATAKMYKYAYNAQDAATEWANMFMQSGLGLASQAGCSDAYSFSLENLISQFGALAGAPDELVPGLDYGKMPCPKGKKASKKCQEKNEREKSEDNNKATQTGNQPPSKTEEDSQPTQTGNERPSTTGDQQQPTQTSKETSSTSDYVGPTAKPDCAAIGRNDFEALMELEIYEEEESLAEKRSLRSTLQSRRLEARRLKPKEGYACIVKDPGGRIRQTKLDSKKYPQSGDKPMEGAPAYGFNVANDCGNYAFGEQKLSSNAGYDTEHVLEWKLVTHFFTTLNSHPDLQGDFKHPDPDEKDKSIDFCKYWDESWEWSKATGRPKLSNPDPNAPPAVSGEDELEQTPLAWFAEAYPFIDGAKGRKAHEDEFILLQKKINGEAKNMMFSTKQGTKLYDDGDMEAIIKRKSTALKKKGSRKGKLAFGEPLDQPRAAIQRMRSVVGAYLYLKEKKVNKIFVDQVNRIGAQLENLENQLAKTPKFVKRKYDDPDGGVVKIEKTVYFHPWKHQKLREKWFEYMDQVYETANQRGQDFMEENLARLEDEYNDSKLKEVQDAFKREKKKKEKDELSLEVQLRQEMKKNIEKLSSHWSKAKNWPRPQWNSQID